MSKVAIVGVEGSGKTVLMGALCECYKQTSEDTPYLMPENQAAFMFMERIPHKLRVERQWPEATNVSSLKSMRWTLRLGADVLEQIEILDYPGELYRIAFGEHKKDEAESHREELNEFLEHVTGADTLIVLLNLGDVQDLGANARNAETVWITRGIFDFAKKVPSIKRTALVFTQADRFQTMLEVQGGAQGVYAKRLPMLKTLYPSLKVMAVSAVSGTDGEGRPKAGYSADGCRELMREILWEQEAEVQISMALCDSINERIKCFNQGSDTMFIGLLDSYHNAVEGFKINAKVLMPVYGATVRAYTARWNDAYLPLREWVSSCETRLTPFQKTKAGWWGVGERFEGCDGIVTAFRNFYLEIEMKKREEERERVEVINEMKAENKMAAIIVGSVFAVVLVITVISSCTRG